MDAYKRRILAAMGKAPEVDVITLKVSLSPIGVNASIEACGDALKEFGAESWYQETARILEPIMKEQTEKFTRLICEKLDLDFDKGIKRVTPSTDIDKMVDDMLNTIFGGSGGGYRP